MSSRACHLPLHGPNQLISDTKLTAKSLVSDIVASAPSLYTSPQGRRALFYLVAPRTRRHFTPAQIATLAETDPIRAKTSKKDDALRVSEIRKAASEGLLAWIAEKGAEVSRDTGGSLVVLEVMLEAEGGTLDFVLLLSILSVSCCPSYRQSRGFRHATLCSRRPLPFH